MDERATGLRERNKRRTRQAISDAATRLFIEHGYDHVTIADVAEAAGVAKMTVTNHFPHKEDLALDAHEEFVGAPARAVADRDLGQSAWTAVREAYFSALADRDPLLGFADPAFARMLADSPALRARLRALHAHRESALADTLVAEATDGVTLRVVAAQLGGVLRVLFDEVQRRLREDQPPDTVAAAIGHAAHTAFELLRPSLENIASRTR
jgi:AcrR family transcriptional regulator